MFKKEFKDLFTTDKCFKRVLVDDVFDRVIAVVEADNAEELYRRLDEEWKKRVLLTDDYLFSDDYDAEALADKFDADRDVVAYDQDGESDYSWGLYHMYQRNYAVSHKKYDDKLDAYETFLAEQKIDGSRSLLYAESRMRLYDMRSSEQLSEYEESIAEMKKEELLKCDLTKEELLTAINKLRSDKKLNLYKLDLVHNSIEHYIDLAFAEAEIIQLTKTEQLQKIKLTDCNAYMKLDSYSRSLKDCEFWINCTIANGERRYTYHLFEALGPLED